MRLNRKARLGLIQRVVSRLKYPQLFLLVGVLFLLDMILWDPLPFLDEIFLGSVAVLLAAWKERREERKPPMENVTRKSPGASRH